MWRSVLFLPLALALLCGCSKTPSHPIIAVTAQNEGSSFQISGSGFSSGSPCATLSYVVLPSGFPQTIESHVPCTSGQLGLPSLPVPSAPFVPWTPTPAKVSQLNTCTANIPISLIAVDAHTGNVATASASILCEATLCPAEFTHTEAQTTSMPTYFSGGHSSNNTQPYPPGPAGLESAFSLDICTKNPDATYARQGTKQVTTGDVDGVQQAGAFEQCTYEIPATTQCPASETLVFTCPDSGACLKPN
jgi:hypothetical protein